MPIGEHLEWNEEQKKKTWLKTTELSVIISV